jgi:two-component sensor histidine kinase
VIEVIDNGKGLPPGFDLDAVNGLGLSIVRTLVTSELSGSMVMDEAPSGRGACVHIRVPIENRPA